jgi:hypothetical protein
VDYGVVRIEMLNVAYVPVPFAQLQAVIELLRADAHEEPEPPREGDPPKIIDPLRGWSVKSIHNATVESPTVMKSFLQYLAEQAGVAVTIADVVEARGLAVKDLRAALSGFSRRTKTRYHRTDWFFEFHWGDGRACYTISPEAAKHVLDALHAELDA